MQANLKIIWDLTRKSVQAWNNDNAAQLAAAIAYYTIFSIPPLLIITLAIGGYFFSTDIAQNQLAAQLERFIGPQSADFLKSLLDNSAPSSSSTLASIISIAVLLLGASGVFNQVQNALNIIWKVPPKHHHRIMGYVKKRFLSFMMVLAIGLLLLLFLILSAALSLLNGSMNPAGPWMLLPEIINFLTLFIMSTLLIAMIYRVIPDKEIDWAEVWLGAGVTAFLFLLGRYAIGFYLSINRSASAFGAAGSLIVLLVWIYYSAQIFLLGAEFTYVFSRKLGPHAQPEVIPLPFAEKTRAPR
jgi:membrane protein